MMKASKYRFISTLSIYSNICEKLIHLKLPEFHTNNIVISDSQFRF